MLRFFFSVDVKLTRGMGTSCTEVVHLNVTLPAGLHMADSSRSKLWRYILPAVDLWILNCNALKSMM